MLPVVPAIEVSRLLIGVAFAGINSETKIREREIDAQTQRIQMEVDARLEKMRIEADVAKVDAQKEIILSLVNLSQHAFDRKMDFFIEGLQNFQALIMQHQQVLLEELQALRVKEFGAELSDSDKILLFKKGATLNAELANLKKISGEVTSEFNMRVASLSPEVRLSLPRL